MYSFDTLKEIHRSTRGTVDESFSIRIHRALSWLQRAEKESENDDDAKFIFLWIAFNAAYGININISEQQTEKATFFEYFRTLLALNPKEISNIIWHSYAHEVRGILDNEFILAAYWKSVTSSESIDWEDIKQRQRKRANKALIQQDSSVILEILFMRLYVLRNHLMHGNATWNGSVNRPQLRDSTKLLEKLLPVFLKTMMDNPHENWGDLSVPVIKS